MPFLWILYNNRLQKYEYQQLNFWIITQQLLNWKIAIFFNQVSGNLNLNFCFETCLNSFVYSKFLSEYIKFLEGANLILLEKGINYLENEDLKNEFVSKIQDFCEADILIDPMVGNMVK